jgi:hypothetical protein
MEVPELSPLNPFRAYDLRNPEKPHQTGTAERERRYCAQGRRGESMPVPLTPPMTRSLDRVRRAGEIPLRLGALSALVFGSRHSHVEEVKYRHLACSPHALRHSFRNFCARAKVSNVQSRLLMNPAIGADNA